MPLIIPDPIRKKRLRAINLRLSEHKEVGDVGRLAQAVALMLEEESFRRYVSANRPKEAVTEADLMKLVWAYLYLLLNADDFAAAAMVLWNEETFTPEPHCVQLIWDALMTKRQIGIIGGGGLGKTYSASAYFFLQWIADPEWTRFQVASASEDHLLKNLYADIVRLHTGASVSLPAVPDSVSISLDKKRGMGIFTLVLPGGPQSKGKIQGAHTKPRPPHPKFGKRSRVFVLIDEAQEVPQNIFNVISNRFSTVVGDDVEHIKFVVCANPKDVYSEFGQCMKPKKGWESVSMADETWESEQGWTVVSLNAMMHENVRERRIVYPGFVTYDGVQVWLRRCHGNADDPQMYTYVYGKFPPSGLASVIIKQKYVAASEGDWIFDQVPANFAANDPAFTGDTPAFSTGRVGRAIGWMGYDGTRHDLPQPKIAIQLDSVSILPRGDTQDLADENLSRCRDLGVLPPHYGIDRTGSGQGVHDIVRRQWVQKVGPQGAEEGVGPIVGIHYAESPSETKIADEDTMTPAEMYDRIASELWFAAGRLFEYDCIRIGRGVDADTLAELTSRQGGMKTGAGKKQSVEGKDAYKARTGRASPDKADATLVLIHTMRMATPGLIPKARDTELTAEPRDQARPWDGFGQAFAGARMDGLDTGKTEVRDMMRD